MTDLNYVFYTIMIYGTSFIFIYVSEVIFEVYMKQFKQYRTIFGGAVFGLSLTMVIFIVNYLNLTGIPDGRFAIILLSGSFFGGLGGAITASIIVVASLLNDYFEVTFLFVEVIMHLVFGVIIYMKKDKGMRLHVILNVAAAFAGLFLGIFFAQFIVKDALVELERIESFVLLVFPLVGLFSFAISVVLVREENRTKSIIEFAKKQIELIESNAKISKLNDKIIKSRKKYKLVLEASDEGFVEYNHYTKTVVLSDRAIEIFDHLVNGPEVSLWDIFNVLDDKDAIKVQKEFQKLKMGKAKTFNVTVKAKQRDEEFKHILFRGIVNRDEDGLITIVGAIKDIHDKVINEEIIYDLAYKDEISGMYNENAFVRDLNKCLMEEQKGNIVFINISGFSGYTSIGMSYRNTIRMHFTAILKQFFYLEDCYYLQDGCFCIHISQDITFKEALVKFEGLNQELLKPIHINDLYIPIKVNGIYLEYPYGNSGSEGLLARGLSAISSLERNNIYNLVLFSEGIYNKQYRLSKLDTYIVKGLNNNELYMMYQPQYDENGKSVVGYEALIRWKSDTFGRVCPAEFIPIAEKNGTIYKIGQFVIREVCSFINVYKDVHGYLPKVSINVSFIEMINPNFANDLNKTVTSYRVPTSQIVVEITETAISEFLDVVLENIRIIRALGFEIHLDDFGTGYSSLNHLGKLSIDCVKIDKSFIDEIHLSDTSYSIVQSIIELSHRIGMKVIAEGIETQEQFVALTKLGCDQYQGYYFDRPLKSEDILNQ